MTICVIGRCRSIVEVYMIREVENIRTGEEYLYVFVDKYEIKSLST